jgi:protein TonB
MITYYKRLTRKMTFAALVMLVSVGFISFTLSGFAEVNQGPNNADIVNVYQLSEIDTPPHVLESVLPEYPVEAKRQLIEGRVTLHFIVTKEGTVRDASVIESNPAGVFDQSALDAIEQFLFEPAIKNEKAVDVWVRMPIAFELGLIPLQK